MTQPQRLIVFVLCASPLFAQAGAAKVGAGVQIGAVDEGALHEKPVIAGGYAGLRVWRSWMAKR
jgi:hypothetical protein